MCVYPIRKLNASSSFVCFPLQQTSDNVEGVKEIERRVQSLSGMLVSPVSEDDRAEKGRRIELQRFVLIRMYISLLIPPQEARGGYCGT